VTALVDEIESHVPASNKAVTIAYRDDVIRYARSRGLGACRPLPDRDRQDAGEIDGVPGWTLLCRRRQTLDIPSAIRQARQRADRDGSEFAAAVLHAKGHSVEDSWAVLPLSELLDLIARWKPEGAS
jgi:hypothetical protein